MSKIVDNPQTLVQARSLKPELPKRRYIDRDISWLSFNARVLDEADRMEVPLLERFRFLSIYSSNLDEFYRVRMPTLMAFHGHSPDSDPEEFRQLLATINSTIYGQLKHFGRIIEKSVVPELRKHKVHLVYNEPVPDFLFRALQDYFIHTVAAYIQVTDISAKADFFPENNRLYIAVTTGHAGQRQEIFVVNVPSDTIPRFFKVSHKNVDYILFLDDIIKLNLRYVFVGKTVEGCHSFKITRDAELDLEDEFEGNLAKKIEKKLRQRDMGLATRFLFEPGIPQNTLVELASRLNLKSASFVQGGAYHNLRDFASLPLKHAKLEYDTWPVSKCTVQDDNSLFEEISKRDILLHPPYHSYDTVLRFFNEAAIDTTVQRIYITLYRVAGDSKIVNALMSAAQNGKKVTVFVELKARFDEANNLRWSKKMKEAGVQIIESIPGLKVHAKLGLVKRKKDGKNQLIGLFSTGNFNENTARFYTDHVLMTAHRPMLKEAERLFKALRKKKGKVDTSQQEFEHLLVGQFNLQPGFTALMDREIRNARNGLKAAITIKFNNLEERAMIDKLYEASQAGVKVSLIVRGICCLKPGVSGLSENITLRRIVDRYLEHGRVFIFHNNNKPLVFLGSADWMIRNIHRRIEVCFPVYKDELNREIMRMVDLQLKDNSKAVQIDDEGRNVPLDLANEKSKSFRSQWDIGKMLAKKYNKDEP